MASREDPRDSTLETCFVVGPVEIRVRSETIQTIVGDTTLDALVSSDDSLLSMQAGVSAAIRELAGSIRDEVAADLPLAVGAIAVTSGGRLPIKYVIHAITVDAHQRVVPNVRTIRQLCREILSRCEALDIQRVAIPALATGAAGVSSEVAAVTLVQAIRSHTANPTNLRSIVLSVPTRPVFQAFVMALAPPEAPGKVGASRLSLGKPAASGPGEDTAESGVTMGAAPRARATQGWFTWRRRETTQPVDLEKVRASRTGAPSTPSASTWLTVDSPATRPLLDGRYVLLEEVGRGGMAIVHLAWDLVLRRTVAIKILRRDCGDPQSLRREAATAFELTHHGIVRMYHFEPPHGGTDAYLVMEYLAWPSGEKWIADAGDLGLPVSAVRAVGLAVCDALAYAHSRKVLHLDVKPSNIFVDPAGESAKLGDFGLARFSGTGGTTLQVRPVGTPAYMAPEQMTVGARVSPATDVYQMAATLWDLLTGFPPQLGSLDTASVTRDREPLATALKEALVPDPALRPSAAGLGQLLSAAAQA
jgi:O-acetyl-ADP-ribose deacetylase (regulator of RNase III)